VVRSIHHVTQADMSDDFHTWARFLERCGGQILSEYWAILTSREEVASHNADFYALFTADLMFEPIVERILHGCLGITQDGHLILGRRLQKHDKIGFIPNSLETFIFRPCGSGYQFITNSWQSDTPELIEVQSLQLGDRDTVTII